jgi:hypothetical protein
VFFLPSGASSVVEVLVPLSCSTRRYSTSSKQVSGASPASLLSVGKRDSTVVRPPLGKLISSEQPAEMRGGAFSPKILVLRRETILLSEGAVIQVLLYWPQPQVQPQPWGRSNRGVGLRG